MLILLSPAKKLDFDSEWEFDGTSQPRLMDETLTLVKKARRLKPRDLTRMMGISEQLAELNVRRFQSFETPFTPTNARPAIDAFKGDVYVGLDAPSLDEKDRAFADQHIRILSGLYGVLRPLDLMQAYRLEMGTAFATRRGENLYDFWGSRIADLLLDDLQDDATIVNLASQEYFKAVDKKALGADVRIITPVFKELKEDKLRVISFFAKRARGGMARYAIDNQITEAEALKGFDYGGYSYSDDLSDGDTWVFTRPQP